MSNIVYTRRFGRHIAMLDDSNLSKSIEDAISICTHGYCARRNNCDIRNHVIESCEELGVFTPIEGCAEFDPNSENELNFNFGDE